LDEQRAGRVERRASAGRATDKGWMKAIQVVVKMMVASWWANSVIQQ